MTQTGPVDITALRLPRRHRTHTNIITSSNNNNNNNNKTKPKITTPPTPTGIVRGRASRAQEEAGSGALGQDGRSGACWATRLTSPTPKRAPNVCFHSLLPSTWSRGEIEIATRYECPCTDCLPCRPARPGWHHLDGHRQRPSYDVAARRKRERESAAKRGRR